MTDEQSSSSSAALERMKAQAGRAVAPETPEVTASSSAPARASAAARTPSTPSSTTTSPAARGNDAARGSGSAQHSPTRLRHARLVEHQNAATRLNQWLDGLGEPDWDAVSDAIYESPTRTKVALQDARVRFQENQRLRAEEKERQAIERERLAKEKAEQEAREAEEAERARQEAEERAAREAKEAAERAEREAREAQERAEREAREAEERRLAEIELERQRAEEEALRAEQERLAAEAELARRQERETRALRLAAREEDGTDYVPPADRRPMLQEPDEELSDEELLQRARESLPEWRRRDRIVEKAQAIEAATERRAQAIQLLESEPEPVPRTYIPPYNLPSTDPDPEPTGLDLLRRITVTLTWAAMVFAGAWSLGMIGDRLRYLELGGGRYTADFSMLSMASWHVAIWPMLWIYLGVHVIHQWLPSQASAERQRHTGWRLAAAMVGVSLWLVLTRLGLPWLDVVLWIGIGYLLVDAIHQFNLYTARNGTERAITDGAIGFFAGWAIIFATSLISVTLQRLGVDLLWIPGSVWAVLALIVVIWGTAMLTMTERGRITIALGLAWGLAAILGPRLIGGPMQSVWVAIVAAMGAFIVLLATENRRYRINHAEHRAALGHEPEDF